VKQLLVTVLAILSWTRCWAESPGSASPSSNRSPNGKVDFSREIKPIFADTCYQCHGAQKQKSGLRLDIRERAMAGGDTGKAIVPGKSAESLLYRYVAGLHPETRMPPKGDGLNAQQIARIRAWIDAGAPWPEDASTKKNVHWS
jgi:mono/diheme cytochrome c family protein